ncbi:MAG TPA: hypothetical protein VNT24_02265 [Propionibacteriaceae bacterium]|nr:hypothetical protein [Propionibacteriaceae bacterium]
MVVFTTSAGTEILPGHRVELMQIPADQGPVDVSLWTRQEDIGLDAPLPPETYMEVALAADDLDAAIAESGAVGTGLARMISCCLNALVPPPDPVLAYEFEPGLEKRKFWQR